MNEGKMDSEEQSGNWLFEVLCEAQTNIEAVGDKLLSKNTGDLQEACALLFVVRESVISVLNELPVNNSSVQELLLSCETDDIAFFSGMVNNLFQSDDRGVYAVATYYTLLVGRLIGFVQFPPDTQQTQVIEVPDFDSTKTDIIGEAYDDDESQIRDHIITLQRDLSDILCILGKGHDMTYTERYEASIEIVRIREHLFNIFREVRHYKLQGKTYQRGSLMEKAFIEDLYSIDSIVPDIIEEGVYKEGIQFVQRLMDFSCKIERFMANGDHSLLEGPFISVSS